MHFVIIQRLSEGGAKAGYFLRTAAAGDREAVGKLERCAGRMAQRMILR